MLTTSELVAVYRSHRDQPVLSVYIDGTAADPAVQRAWRTKIDRALKAIRGTLAHASHDEREAFERSALLLAGELANFDHTIQAPGWVAFITPMNVIDAHALPAAVPTLAMWTMGPCITPYVRTLDEARPVIVAVGDARKMSINRYRVGTLDHVDTVRAHHVTEQVLHMGTAPRQGFHVGTHGRTGRDMEQRSHLEGRDRMLAEAASRIMNFAGVDGWILLGGNRRVRARLASLLESAKDRVMELPSLDVHASDAEIAVSARAGASALREMREEQRVATIVERAGAQGLGVVGAVDTEHALAERSVHDVYITPHCVDIDMMKTEAVVRSALDQNATVEEVAGRAAATLDALGGIAAGLRFRGQRSRRPTGTGRLCPTRVAASPDAFM